MKKMTVETRKVISREKGLKRQLPREFSQWAVEKT
jgi:hypothetical protein